MTPYDSRRLRELAALRLVWASAAWLTNPNFHKLGPGICTRDTRDNSGPGGKPAQYRSKTPPKGHTRFTHTVHAHTVHTHCSHTRTTKNKVERLPSLRCARALQYHCLTPMLTPVWYHSAHAPSTVQLAIWAAPARFVTPRRRRALSSCCRLAGFKEGKLPSCSRARPQPQAVEAASCSRLDRQTFCSRHVRREPSLLGLDVYGSSEPENQP